MAQVGVQLHGQVARLLMASGVKAALRERVALIAEANRIAPPLAWRCSVAGHNGRAGGTLGIVCNAPGRTSDPIAVCASAHRIAAVVAGRWGTP